MNVMVKLFHYLKIEESHSKQKKKKSLPDLNFISRIVKNYCNSSDSPTSRILNSPI